MHKIKRPSIINKTKKAFLQAGKLVSLKLWYMIEFIFKKSHDIFRTFLVALISENVMVLYYAAC